MTSAPRFLHTVSLNSEEESKLQLALKKIKAHSGGKYGVKDIFMIGINRLSRHTKVDK